MSQFNFNYIFQNKNIRLPATISSLEPDCSSINLAEKSNQPKDWLLHPTGCVFQFHATAFFKAKEKFELIQSALKNGDKISTLEDVFMMNNEMTKLRAKMIEKVAKSAQTQVENEILTKLVKFWEN